MSLAAASLGITVTDWAELGFGAILEHVLTGESAVVRFIGGDNRLAAVVIGGVSLAIASGLVTVVKEKGLARREEAASSLDLEGIQLPEQAK